MNEHLPECGVRKPCGVCGNITYGVCICDRLRACEQRVRVNERDWRDQAFGIGYAAALDAAREAVAALPYTDNYDHECQWETVIREDAMAAIDALREEKK